MLILDEVRCPQCGKRLADMSGQARIKCPRCRAMVEVDTEARKIYTRPERQK